MQPICTLAQALHAALASTPSPAEPCVSWRISCGHMYQCTGSLSRCGCYCEGKVCQARWFISEDSNDHANSESRPNMILYYLIAFALDFRRLLGWLALCSVLSGIGVSVHGPCIMGQGHTQPGPGPGASSVQVASSPGLELLAASRAHRVSASRLEGP